jgi:hypothetical protein
MKKNAVLDASLPDGVTQEMVVAGMEEWDRQMDAGNRNWWVLLPAVYLAMKSAGLRHDP